MKKSKPGASGAMDMQEQEPRKEDVLKEEGAAQNQTSMTVADLLAEGRSRSGGALEKLAQNALLLAQRGLPEPEAIREPSLKKRLAKAIERMSIEDAQSAIADGADMWRGTLFYGDYGIEGAEQVAGFDKESIPKTSGKSFVFQAWGKGVAKLMKKHPQKVAAMSVYLEGLGFALNGEVDDHGRSWLEGRRPAMGQGRARTAAQISKERRAAIGQWCSKPSWGSGWCVITGRANSNMALAMTSLVKRWHEEPPEDGGLPPREWSELILAEMASGSGAGDSWGDAWEVLADLSQAFGETFTAAQWEKVASITSKSLREGSYVADSIKKALKIPGEKIGARAASKIMALAVSLQDVEMLALIASRAQSVHWVEREVACDLIFGQEQNPELLGSDPVDVPMLALALFSEKRMIGKRVLDDGRSCFEALASIPEAVEAALATPSPRAMAGVDEVEFQELALRFPGIDKPDAMGNNVAHGWAVLTEMDKCKRKRFVRLLNSPLKHLATEKNAAGETPLSLMQKVLYEDQKEKWAKNFAAWEKKDLAKTSEEPAANGTAPARARRSL